MALLHDDSNAFAIGPRLPNATVPGPYPEAGPSHRRRLGPASGSLSIPESLQGSIEQMPVGAPQDCRLTAMR